MWIKVAQYADIMPSYLNYKGCEVEGLYRVPGGTRDIKAWEKRFDIGTTLSLAVSTNLR